MLNVTLFHCSDECNYAEFYYAQCRYTACNCAHRATYKASQALCFLSGQNNSRICARRLLISPLNVQADKIFEDIQDKNASELNLRNRIKIISSNVISVNINIKKIFFLSFRLIRKFVILGILVRTLASSISLLNCKIECLYLADFQLSLRQLGIAMSLHRVWFLSESPGHCHTPQHISPCSKIFQSACTWQTFSLGSYLRVQLATNIECGSCLKPLATAIHSSLFAFVLNKLGCLYLVRTFSLGSDLWVQLGAYVQCGSCL